MSMLLMVKAMQTRVGNPVKKLVLIKLADNANDKGECWPSYQNIADHCEVDKRTVMRHIKELQASGYVRKETRIRSYGNTSNMYYLSLPSDPVSPPSDPVSLPPSDPVSPRISHSLEPVSEPVNKDIYSGLDFSSWPDKPSEEVLAEWLSLRKRKKAKVTDLVLKAMGKELTLSSQKGYTVDQCLTECVLNNWQGFKSSWLKDSIPDNPIDYSDIPIDSIIKLYNDIIAPKIDYRVGMVSDQLKRDIARRCRGGTNSMKSQWWAQLFSVFANFLNTKEPKFRSSKYRLERLVGTEWEDVCNENNINLA